MLIRSEWLSRVWLFATPWIVARHAPLSMGILQAGILEWVAIAFSEALGVCRCVPVFVEVWNIKATPRVAEGRKRGKTWIITLQQMIQAGHKPYVSSLSYNWCWSWSSNTLATRCKELTRWKRLWCWERLRAGGEGDDRGWDGCMTSLTRWTGVWVSSGSWWWTGRSGVLQSVGSQRVGHDWATKQQQEKNYKRM